MTPAQQIKVGQLIEAVYNGLSVLPEGWQQLGRVMGEDAAPMGVIALETASGKVAAAFRGTANPLDALRDAEFAFTRSPFMVGMTEFGFTRVYEALTPLPYLPLIDWFAGHSLGGPVATLYGLQHGHVNSELLLIASPEPGDLAFAQASSPHFAAIHRWDNPHDVVPDAPGRFLGYRDLMGPTTAVDFSCLNIPWFDPLGNHSLANYLAAFQADLP